MQILITSVYRKQRFKDWKCRQNLKIETTVGSPKVRMQSPADVLRQLARVTSNSMGLDPIQGMINKTRKSFMAEPDQVRCEA